MVYYIHFGIFILLLGNGFCNYFSLSQINYTKKKSLKLFHLNKRTLHFSGLITNVSIIPGLDFTGFSTTFIKWIIQKVKKVLLQSSGHKGFGTSPSSDKVNQYSIDH